MATTPRKSTRMTVHDAGGAYAPTGMLNERKQYEPSLDGPAGTTGQYASDQLEHVASFQTPYERDSRGGSYGTMQDEDGFHVFFLPGTALETGAVSGVTFKTFNESTDTGPRYNRGQETDARTGVAPGSAPTGDIMSPAEGMAKGANRFHDPVNPERPVGNVNRLQEPTSEQASPGAVARAVMGAKMMQAGNGKPTQDGRIIPPQDVNSAVVKMNRKAEAARKAGAWGGRS